VKVAAPAQARHRRRVSGKKPARYDRTLTEIAGLITEARRGSARAVNTIMTATYWLIGRRIVVEEQAGAARAGYGEELIKRLAADLTARFGRGFGWRNLFQMRAFYLMRPDILQTLSATSGNLQTPSAESFRAAFPLPWSHYVRLLAVKDDAARRFYEAEALRGGWTVRQLARQIDSQFYERAAMSRNQRAMLARGGKPAPGDALTPEEELKDPFVLEFLALKDEYSEGDLEEALIRDLETFLLELGGDFAFVGRQRRLRVGDAWYRIDLLFFHRRLRCLVIVDLKLGAFTHADAGQMHLYLNYAREHWTVDGENPPVGLILCASKDEAVAKYALEGLPNKVMAAQYKTALPKERMLIAEIEKTWRALQARRP
jgi:predicted nuclease of restriction endonuclease-like (RecB) superfamily